MANRLIVNSITGVKSEIIYNRVAEQALANTGFAFTSSVNPSGAENHRYSWTQIDKRVFLHAVVNYVTNGTSVSTLTFPFPADLPKPAIPSGFTGASTNLYLGHGKIIVSLTTLPSATNTGFSIIRSNSGNTDYEIYIGGTGVSARIFIVDIVYDCV